MTDNLLFFDFISNSRYNNVPRLVEKDSVIYLHKEFKDVFINKISKSSSNPIFTPFRLQ